MKKLLSLICAMTALLFVTSCDNKEPNPGDGQTPGGEQATPVTTIIGHAFSFETNDPILNDMVYNVQFQEDDTFTFWLSKESSNGEIIGKFSSTYSTDEDEISFDIYDHSVTFPIETSLPPYTPNYSSVTLAAASIVYKDDSKTEITALNVLLKFGDNPNPISYTFTPSEFRSSLTVNIPKITSVVGNAFSFSANGNLFYNIEFLSDDVYIFWESIKSGAGEWVCHVTDFYSKSGDELSFENKQENYPGPVTATILYKDDSKTVIDGLEVALKFSRNSVPTTYTLRPSQYKSNFDYESPNLTKKDFSGSVWKRVGGVTRYFLFFEDGTYMLRDKYDFHRPSYSDSSIESSTWSFDESTQTLNCYEGPYYFINKSNDTYYTTSGSQWTKITIDEAVDGNPERIVVGSWIDDDGRTLNSNLSGTAMPPMPVGDKKRYDSQRLLLEGSVTGSYRIERTGHYRWSEITGVFIPTQNFADTTDILGTYEMQNLFESYAAQRLVLTGVVTGTFRHASN